jgi:hypothetical protein
MSPASTISSTSCDATGLRWWSTSGSGGACAAASTPGRTRAGCKRRSSRPASSTGTFPNWRQLQYREDERRKVGKRSRVELAEEYRRRYLREILDKVDLGAVLASLPDEATTALLCVERDAQACHRSLIAARLHDQYAVAVLNL